jgi:anti-sigma B factor antagonist
MINVNVVGVDNVTLVEVEGRIDSMNANQLGEALAGAIDDGGVQIVLDLAGVDYMSSAGLREIVNALKKVKPSGDVRIARPTDRVREVLDMAGLSTILQIFSSQNDALASY